MNQKINMISALCHKITPGKGNDGFQAITSLELVRDSYGRKPNSSSSSSSTTGATPVNSQMSSSEKGVTQADIAEGLSDENALMSQQEQVIAQTPPNGTKYDDEGYPADAGSEFEYNPVTGRLDPKD